jgi:hypothetical protein
MTRYTSISVTMAAGVILAGCATPHGDTTPKSASSAAEKTNCLNQTASRITADSDCQGIGRSYSKEDIARTGAITAGQALPRLDPSITVQH